VDALPALVAAGVEKLLGASVCVVEDLTSPWAATTRSVRANAREGSATRQIVVQWAEGTATVARGAMRRRIRLGRELARLAPELPIAEVLGGDTATSPPYLVSRFVEGISGREFLGDDAGAAILGGAVGRAARDIVRVPSTGLHLSRTWSAAELLQPAARRWLVEAASDLAPISAGRVREVIERLPDVFAGTQPAFAHGDLAPVNVLLRDGAVVALLDFERARLAHPLFDASWWRWVVRYHHPARGRSAVGAFLSAAGIVPSASTSARLDDLAVLQCLEMLALTPRRDRVARLEWARRVAAALELDDSTGTEERDRAQR
jgi:aminoglycoside phosphotransferase (APT) family kinase protein